MQFSLSSIALYATLFVSVSALPLSSRALSSQTYAELSISGGTAGNAQAEAEAKIPIDTSDLANISKADLKIIQGIHDVAEDAETDAFNPALDKASGSAKTALQVLTSIFSRIRL